jgi:hypothetical protein
MGQEVPMESVFEPPKNVPIIADADVCVAGAGVSGVFAAIASARAGAKTILIDRFGSVGGNMGPGMIVNGQMLPGTPHPDVLYTRTIYPGVYGLAEEFINRYAALGGGLLQPYTKDRNFSRGASVASYLALKMLEESGAQVLTSTFVCDPVMDGVKVCGVFVENKSGRGAIQSKVVIDATGEADVARRAGAPILFPKAEYQKVDGHAPTGMENYYVVGGIAWDRFFEAQKTSRPTPEDIEWSTRAIGAPSTNAHAYVLPFLRRAVESGAYHPVCHIELAGKSVRIHGGGIGQFEGNELGHGRVQIERVEEVNAGDGSHMSLIEGAFQAYAFNKVQFFRDHVPGFENAFLITVAPFLGSRGGPCIEGEYTLTMDDCVAGKRFDDVIYLYGEFRALKRSTEAGETKWVDVPYRVLVPRKIDGLLATGRSASGIPDTLLRNRLAVKVMGQACGIAAALAVKAGIVPRDLPVRELQAALLDAGFYLGNRQRLGGLGLS